MPADWQLPPGVSRGLWEYVHDQNLARAYDDLLAGTPLLEIDLQFALGHFTNPGRCIDLGCGTGRLALRLAKQGIRVLAVDLSEEMLKVAGEKAAQASVEIDLLKANLVELDGIRDQSFDYAACLFSTLGMIAGKEARRRFLEHVHRLLKPGGVFVVHVHNRWFHLWTRGGRRLLLRNFWESLQGPSALGDFLMPPHQGIGRLTMHLFSRWELQRLMRKIGFTVTTVQSVGHRVDGKLSAPWWLPSLRAYGYLLACRKENPAGSPRVESRERPLGVTISPDG